MRMMILASALLVLAAVMPWATARRLASPRSREPNQQGLKRGAGTTVDEAVVLDIVRAAILAGASILRALEVVGAALPPRQGGPLVRAARSLRLGADWDQAWDGATSPARRLARCLKPAWIDGVSPVPLLEQGAQAIRASRARRAREAAAKLGVRLVLPLGLTFLPAFILVGLVPVLISTGESLFGGP